MTTTTIWWVRKEFRLDDNPALDLALQQSDHVIPVFILDPETEAALGAAPKWRLSRAIEKFTPALEGLGSRLILRRGPALETLLDLIQETGANRVVWGRQYDPAAKARDTAVKSALKERDIEAESVCSHLIREPWHLETKTGGPYRVYTPFRRSFFASAEDVFALDPPNDVKPVKSWPRSEALKDWALEEGMNRGGAIVARHAEIGEAAALERLQTFLDAISDYDTDRDRPDRDGTSRLSAHLAWGEISPRRIWCTVKSAAEEGDLPDGPRVYLQEIVWREFAYHLLHHYPHLAEQNWREGWDDFPWRGDNDDAELWRRGLTGMPIVDAAMRELYVTGHMHNRMRMLTASVLTKHLLTDWRIGEAWFRDCLVDWDPAANAMGWQWVAGCGPDATPFFRIFNPETQRGKFDPNGHYVARWVAERSTSPDPDALSYFDAIPRSWGLSADANYPELVIALDVGRKRALAAYAEMKEKAA